VTVQADRDLQAQRDYALNQLMELQRRGQYLHGALASDRGHAESLAHARLWQEACASAIHQLAGGSKAHWLSREYSAALLVRSADGGAVVETDVATIVGRIVDILEKAIRSLSQMDDVAVASSAAVPPKRRFEFVHNAELRPVLEQAFIASGEAFEAGDYERALLTSSGILEAILTDALEARPNDGSISAWSFQRRIAAAEAAGLIRGSCRRLPPVALAYRDSAADDAPARTAPINERDAKIARQVLHVVMRDLDPGR